ncbi:hypothetical protein [Halobacteriovorax sp. JY17]|uniref:hypothetical protein n=1 Tax=Halobacteriovorax sp. JY17 TaxID=2014617 RepID=UPI000C59414D|nr:hypothetical protein [Halobacteriovorax sp. JY17]PIK13574.1 MAG: hypothetical protein CES88_15400 [Halobacteriovorax sp. JY17]
MIKKVCLSLSFVLFVLICTILLLPISLFQESIVELINSSGSVEIQVNKPITYRLINAHKFSAKEVVVKVSGHEVILDNVDIKVDLGSLFKKNIIVESLNIKINSIKEYEKKTEAPKVHEKTEKKSAKEGIDSILVQNFNLQVNSIDIKKYKIDDIALSSKRISVELKPFFIESELNISVFKKMIDGQISLTKQELQNIKINLLLKDIGKVTSKFNLKDINLYGDLNLDFKGELNRKNDFLENDMNLVVNGKKLKWLGKDLDKILDAYIDSKKVGLLDAAGYLTLGPIGILVAKGTDLGHAGLRGMTSGETEIRELHLDLKFQKSMIDLQDVAIATNNHKIVAKGKINLKEKVFKDFSVASVDEKGCSVFTQKISGPLSSPEIGALGSFMNEVFSPITDLFNRGMSLVTDNCDGYYKGIVK